MSTFKNMAKEKDEGSVMGLIICSGCNELIDILPTNGVQIIYGCCGREKCKSCGSETV
ncbi:GapA-binding peptide SR1P [Paenibacillus faecalis]|uniref:GapA-binding peptide SR1P n=1 Tax=Paenibacillus faecalis TaxID=2079532 RepID=UPI000D114AE8|nr:GapA-binding peptide SR1P [Paenibacillus faecalis]